MKTFAYFIRDAGGWHRVSRARYLFARRAALRWVRDGGGAVVDGFAFAKVEDRPW